MSLGSVLWQWFTLSLLQTYQILQNNLLQHDIASFLQQTDIIYLVRRMGLLSIIIRWLLIQWDFLRAVLYIFTEICNKTSVSANLPILFTHMKAIIIILALPLLMNPAVILDTCVQYTYPNSKVYCSACREGYYLNFAVCFQCSSPLPPECSTKSLNSTVTSAPAPPPVQKSKQFLAPAPALNQSSLQNCKQINKQGKCTSCFGVYKLNDLGQCFIEQKSEDFMSNCLVFTEVYNKCLICQDNFTIIDSGACKPDTLGISGSNGLAAYALQTNLTYSQSDKSQLLNLSDNRPNISLYVDDKKLLPQNQQVFDLISNLNSSSLKPLDLKPTQIPSPILPIGSPKAMASIDNNTIIINSNSVSDLCMQYSKQKNCTKCKQGNLLNPLSGDCVVINKPIDLQNTNKRIIRVADDRYLDTNISTELGNTSSLNKTTKGTNNLTTNYLNNTSTNSTMNKIILNNSTSISNFTVQSPPSTILGPRPSIYTSPNGPPPIKLTSNRASPSSGNNLISAPNNNTKISSNSTSNDNFTQSSSIKNNTNKTTANNTSNTNTTANTTVNTSNINGVSQANSTNNEQKYNITIITDPKTGTVVKIIGTTKNPPVKIPMCLKYRDITYECVQCETTYILYTGKCLDAWDYEQATKNKKAFYNVFDSANK